jgi:hypothetical protein
MDAEWKTRLDYDAVASAFSDFVQHSFREDLSVVMIVG